MGFIITIKLWLIFLGRLFEAVFPTNIVLLCFSWRGLKECWKSPGGRFLIILIVEMIISRLIIFFSGLPYQGRYLYPLAICLAIIAACGLDRLISLLKEIKALKSAFATKITSVMIILMVAICIGKGLWYSSDKLWIKEVSSFVQKSAVSFSVRPVLISGVDDLRLAYYSNAEYLRLTFKDFSRYLLPEPRPRCQIQKTVRTSEDARTWVPIFSAITAKELDEGFKKIEAPKVFLFLEDKDKEIFDMFEEAKIPFPFKQVAIFREGKKKTFVLYERIEQ